MWRCPKKHFKTDANSPALNQYLKGSRSSTNVMAYNNACRARNLKGESVSSFIWSTKRTIFTTTHTEINSRLRCAFHKITAVLCILACVIKGFLTSWFIYIFSSVNVELFLNVELLVWCYFYSSDLTLKSESSMHWCGLGKLTINAVKSTLNKETFVRLHFIYGLQTCLAGVWLTWP